MSRTFFTLVVMYFFQLLLSCTFSALVVMLGHGTAVVS